MKRIDIKQNINFAIFICVILVVFIYTKGICIFEVSHNTTCFGCFLFKLTIQYLMTFQ